MSNLPVGYFEANIGLYTSWRSHFYEYQAAVECFWQGYLQGMIPPDRHPLPFLCLVRHTAELGYKTNLLELYSAVKPQDLKPIHNLGQLHQMLGETLKLYLASVSVSDARADNCLSYYKKASKLTHWLNKMDLLGDAFRYPFENVTKTDPVTKKDSKVTGMKSHFLLTEKVNLLTDVMEPYKKTMIFLNHTADVLGLGFVEGHR